MHENSPPVWCGMLQHRAALRLTWRGRAVLLLVAISAAVVVLRGLYPFLAVNDPRPGGVLVVEGWVPDHVIAAAMAEYGRTTYELFLASGGPLEKGAPFFEQGDYAHFGAATAVKLGFDAARIHAVPAPEARQDRTYVSAVSVREWLKKRGAPVPGRINVVSSGPHARRSRLMYEKAFAGIADVGVVAVDERAYDGRRWWASSAGVRSVVGELLAYGYARLLFRAP